MRKPGFKILLERITEAVGDTAAIAYLAAREAVAKWRFRPGSQDGLAMPTTLPVSFQFTLVDRR